jgi:uncharacterized membrane protein YfcA
MPDSRERATMPADMAVELSAWQWAFAALAVTLGATIQASLGLGFALVAAPCLALISPELVPGPILLSSTLLSASVALREARHIDTRGIGWALLGRLPGSWLGATALAALSGPKAEFAFGAIVLGGVAMSLAGPRIPQTSATLIGAGFVSGIMGTMTSIGGPPMALTFQHEQGPRLRATLSSYFAAGAAISIALLALHGRFGLRELRNTLLLLPPTFFGVFCAGFTRDWLDRGRTRAGVLVVALVSAAGLIVKALR